MMLNKFHLQQNITLYNKPNDFYDRARAPLCKTCMSLHLTGQEDRDNYDKIAAKLAD